MAPKLHALAPSLHRGRGAPEPGTYIHRVIPFGGGLGELWNWEYDGVSEVVCDLDWRLINFWLVLQDDYLFDKFQRLAAATPFGENEWEQARVFVREQMGALPALTADGLKPLGPASDQQRAVCALAFFVLVRQSLAGRMKSFTGVTKTRVRNGMNNEVSAWLSSVDGLPDVHARLKRVLILDPAPAVKVIKAQDGPATLFYLDPPYPHASRSAGATDVYGCEMTDAQHAELLQTVAGVRGLVMLSSYPNDLYEGYLRPRGWRCHAFEVTSSADSARVKGKRTEIVWTNYDPPS
jgi:DNA adenine methylase